jgi:hypothetical protein
MSLNLVQTNVERTKEKKNLLKENFSGKLQSRKFYFVKISMINLSRKI